MKVKHGKSQEITDQLSERAAIAFEQWIGCATNKQKANKGSVPNGTYLRANH